MIHVAVSLVWPAALAVQAASVPLVVPAALSSSTGLLPTKSFWDTPDVIPVTLVQGVVLEVLFGQSGMLQLVASAAIKTGLSLTVSLALDVNVAVPLDVH